MALSQVRAGIWAINLSHAWAPSFAQFNSSCQWHGLLLSAHTDRFVTSTACHVSLPAHSYT